MTNLLSGALGMFLYFPEDKSEYIPAVISFSIFLLAAIFTMRFIISHSKKQEEKARKFEKELLNKEKKIE